MIAVKVDYSGLSPNLVPRVQQVLNTIVNDPTTNMLIDANTTKLTINFGHLGAGDDGNLATTAANRQTITFNLDKLKPQLSNGEVVFNIGGGDEKPFFATAVHEVNHIELPDLTNKAFHGGLPDPAASDLTRGQDATGELAFRLTTLQQIRVLFNTTDQTEQTALQNARNELNSNPTTKPSVSGINWNSLTADDIYGLLGDKSSSFYLHLPPAARARTYDVGDPTQHHDPSLIEEDFDDGSSVTTERDIFNTETWSSVKTFTGTDGNVRTVQTIYHSLGGQLAEFDPKNTHPYTELDITTDSTGKPTAVQVKLDNDTATRSTNGSLVDLSVIGQVFGSSIGRILAPNNQFGHVLGGTVGGLIGQKLAQNFTASLTFDASKATNADFTTFSGLDVASAAAGSVASFLIAEIATSIGLNGVGAQMFNAAVGGYLGSVLNQVRAQGFNVLTAVVDWNVALTASEVNIASAFGSFLAHQFVHPESQFGAVGGQFAGAVGSALAYSFSVGLTTALNVFLPGVGAFFGTIIGTIIGDVIAGDPHYPKATNEVQVLDSDPNHFTNRPAGHDDGGNLVIAQELGDQVTKTANSYLDAVHGAAIYYSGKVMIGYNAGAAPYQYITGWFPNGTEVTPHFASATDAIQEGVRELLINTEVIGGDLLVKRAHEAFINGPHPDRNRRVKARGVVRAGGWRRARRTGASMACTRKRFA